MGASRLRLKNASSYSSPSSFVPLLGNQSRMIFSLGRSGSFFFSDRRLKKGGAQQHVSLTSICGLANPPPPEEQQVPPPPTNRALLSHRQIPPPSLPKRRRSKGGTVYETQEGRRGGQKRNGAPKGYETKRRRGSRRKGGKLSATERSKRREMAITAGITVSVLSPR